MKKMVMVAAVLFALCLTTAQAMEELPRRSVDGQNDMGNYCDMGGCGWLHVYNEDWVGMTMDFSRLPNILISRNNGLPLQSGSQSSISLPAGRYTLQGENGRSMAINILPYRTESLHFFGVEEGGRHATAVQDNSGVTALLTNYDSRIGTHLPPPPAPPLPVIHHDGWHDGGPVWDGGGSPWGNEQPWSNPGPVRPHRTGPPIIHQGPPPVEQHPYYVPHIRY